jgi:hypothetical protein
MIEEIYLQIIIFLKIHIWHKNPKMPMKKPRQLFFKSQDAYEKVWKTNVPKNPCNLWKNLSSLGAYESTHVNYEKAYVT